MISLVGVWSGLVLLLRLLCIILYWWRLIMGHCVLCLAVWMSTVFDCVIYLTALDSPGIFYIVPDLIKAILRLSNIIWKKSWIISTDSNIVSTFFWNTKIFSRSYDPTFKIRGSCISAYRPNLEIRRGECPVIFSCGCDFFCQFFVLRPRRP